MKILLLLILSISSLFPFTWLEKEDKFSLIVPNTGLSIKQKEMIQRIIEEIHNYTDIPKEDFLISDEQAIKFFTYYNNYRLIIFGNEYNNKTFQLIENKFIKTRDILNLPKNKLPYKNFTISEYFGFFLKTNINMIINIPQVLNYQGNYLLHLNNRPINKSNKESIFVYLNSDSLLDEIVYSVRNNIYPYIFTHNPRKEYYNITYEKITPIPKKFKVKENFLFFLSYGQENLKLRQQYNFIDYKNTIFAYTLRYKQKNKYIKASLFQVKKQTINWEKNSEKIFENKKVKVFKKNNAFFFIIDKYIFIITAETSIIKKLIKQWQ